MQVIHGPSTKPSQKQLFMKLVHIIRVVLRRNEIQEICGTFSSATILFLDLEFNNISELHKKCFAALYRLKILKLNNNNITQLDAQSFFNLSNLKTLNLSNNPQLHLQEPTLKFTGCLKLFSVENVSFTNLHFDSFHEVNVTVIITTVYHICCVTSQETMCLVDKLWHVSCSFLPKVSMKWFYLVVSICVLVFCVTSSVIYFSNRKSQKTFSPAVVSINVSDMLCSAYLTCIWVTDHVYQTGYLVSQRQAGTSSECYGAYFVVLWYTLLTQFVLIFLALSRLMLVVHPMDSKFKRLRFTLKLETSAYALTSVVAVVLTCIFVYFGGNSTVSLCLPFINDPSGSVILTQVLAWVTAISQTVTSIAIVVIHTLLVRKLKESQKNI